MAGLEDLGHRTLSQRFEQIVRSNLTTGGPVRPVLGGAFVGDGGAAVLQPGRSFVLTERDGEATDNTVTPGAGVSKNAGAGGRNVQRPPVRAPLAPADSGRRRAGPPSRGPFRVVRQAGWTLAARAARPVPSPAAQGDHRVDPRGAGGGHPAGQQGHGQQGHRGQQESGGITGRHAVELALDDGPMASAASPPSSTPAATSRRPRATPSAAPGMSPRRAPCGCRSPWSAGRPTRPAGRSRPIAASNNATRPKKLSRRAISASAAMVRRDWSTWVVTCERGSPGTSCCTACRMGGSGPRARPPPARRRTSRRPLQVLPPRQHHRGPTSRRCCVYLLSATIPTISG